MWWNFVGRTHEEVAQARADWEAQAALPDAGRRNSPLRPGPRPRRGRRPRGRRHPRTAFARREAQAADRS